MQLIIRDLIYRSPLNMFVHNNYHSAHNSALEICANELAPVLDFMHSYLANEQ